MQQRIVKILVPLGAVVVLVAIAWMGVALLPGEFVFCVVIPYLAFAIFIVGFVYRVVLWGRSAVPFKIPTTTGQQKTLPWIKQNKIENPDSTLGVVGKMALEVLFFRSLFKNSKTEKRGGELGIGSAKWLWLGGLMFHWAFLIVILRHLRFFFEPVPGAILGLEAVDSFLQIGVPVLYITDVLILCALTFLFLRRVAVPRVRYISLPADFFPLFLLLAIAISGILMRYIFKVDIMNVKEVAMGLVTLHPVTLSGIAPVFYIHLFMVCVLLAYFPWSKLMHAGGIFLSPTRNQPNNSRAVRHENPWNYPVPVHTYAEYEDEFRSKMIKVGLPVEHQESAPVNKAESASPVEQAESKTPTPADKAESTTQVDSITQVNSPAQADQAVSASSNERGE